MTSKIILRMGMVALIDDDDQERCSLGVFEPKLPPTAEELKRREEFAKSPTGIAMREMFELSNKYMAEIAAQGLLDRKLWEADAANNYQWPVSLVNPDESRKAIKINVLGFAEGDKVRIHLPNDYQVKAE